MRHSATLLKALGAGALSKGAAALLPTATNPAACSALLASPSLPGFIKSVNHPQPAFHISQSFAVGGSSFCGRCEVAPCSGVQPSISLWPRENELRAIFALTDSRSHCALVRLVDLVAPSRPIDIQRQCMCSGNLGWQLCVACNLRGSHGCCRLLLASQQSITARMTAQRKRPPPTPRARSRSRPPNMARTATSRRTQASGRLHPKKKWTAIF